MSHKEKTQEPITNSAAELVDALQKLNQSISALSASLMQVRSEIETRQETLLEFDMALIEEIYPPETVH